LLLHAVKSSPLRSLHVLQTAQFYENDRQPEPFQRDWIIRQQVCPGWRVIRRSGSGYLAERLRQFLVLWATLWERRQPGRALPADCEVLLHSLSRLSRIVARGKRSYVGDMTW